MNVQKNSLRNTILNILLYLMQFVFGFIGRKLIINYIGLEVLGVNSVIVDTISMLSLCELGIQTSVIYKMYSAIAKEDHTRLDQLYSVFRYAYKIIGTVIFVIGICFIPFVHKIVNTSLKFEFVLFVYLIQLALSASNYFFSCPRLLYLANQKQSTYLKQDIIYQCIVFILHVLVIKCFQNYIIYLSVSVLNVIVPNAYLKNRIKHDYKYINYKTKPSKDDLKNSFFDIRDILVGSIATFIYTSTDNFIISYVFGALTVGLIANYKTITNAIRSIIELFSNNMSPVWGNYLYRNVSSDQIYRMIRIYNFVQFIICSLLLVPTITLGNMFITMWLGDKYIIDKVIIYLIAADLFVNSMQQPFCMILRAYGLFKEDKINCIIAAVLNLGTSIILCKIVGLEGVLIGTIIALIWFLVSRIRITLKHLKFDGLKSYGIILLEIVQYALLFSFMTFVSGIIVEFFTISNQLIKFIVCGLFEEILVGFMIVFVYSRSERMKFVISKVLKPIIKRV